MPRQSRGPAPAPKRPVAAPARPAPPSVNPQQTRQASTAAHPPHQQQAQAPPQQQSQGSGLFGQMASTAAGVAVGSSIGHAIGGFFGGGSSSAAPAEQSQAPATTQQDAYFAQSVAQQAPRVCANEVEGFKRCMDENQGNLTICGWYMDQLKACQSAASPY